MLYYVVASLIKFYAITCTVLQYFAVTCYSRPWLRSAKWTQSGCINAYCGDLISVLLAAHGALQRIICASGCVTRIGFSSITNDDEPAVSCWVVQPPLRLVVCHSLRADVTCD